MDMQPKRFKIVEDDWVDKEDVYSDEGRLLLVEDDELSPAESGFMDGYEEAAEGSG